MGDHARIDPGAAGDSVAAYRLEETAMTGECEPVTWNMEQRISNVDHVIAFVLQRVVFTVQCSR